MRELQAVGHDHPSDEALLQRAQGGDEEAFTALYRRRHAGIYRFALAMSGSRSVAEDVTQEAFMILSDGSKRYNAGRGTVASYLFGVARNLVRKQRNRNRCDAQAWSWEDGQKEPVAAGNPLDDVTRRETIELVRKAVLALPSAYREVAVLCDLEGQGYAEAARALGCTEGTVASRLNRARALLQRKLGTAMGAAAAERPERSPDRSARRKGAPPERCRA